MARAHTKKFHKSPCHTHKLQFSSLFSALADVRDKWREKKREKRREKRKEDAERSELRLAGPILKRRRRELTNETSCE